METENRPTPPRRADELSLIAGKVYFVGSGPGDPGLLTLRAAELLRAADVVILDSQVSAEVIARIGSHARILDPAKKKSGKKRELTPEDIEQLIVDEGRKGKIVVRLKCGDPFVFSGGGEEAETLRKAGVPFEIVPGVTTAIAAPAYAGIPVTHSLGGSTVVLVNSKDPGFDSISWSALGSLGGTLIFLGGTAAVTTIASRLQEAGGMDASTPAAVVSHGTTRRQRTVSGTIGTIAERSLEIDPAAQSLLVVGEVVRLQESIGWFESKPLFGRTIVVTRARAQSSGLVKLLENEGASVVQFPMIEIRPPEEWASLDAVLDRVSSYEWIVFSSSNGVDAFFERLGHHGKDLRVLASCRIAAVGEATATSLHNRGIIPDLVPEKFQAAALIPHFPEDLTGVQIAIVRALSGKDDLLMELRHRGARVDLGVAYQTRPSRGLRDQLGSMLGSGRIDAITFTSASTVDNFFEQLTDDERKNVISNIRLASIGPVTSEALRSHGVRPAIEAPEATIHALKDALVERFSRD
ncbi:MAG: uroporphyrinogen-III C-methyltransferase [Thermoanaerobaculia bacterium]